MLATPTSPCEPADLNTQKMTLFPRQTGFGRAGPRPPGGITCLPHAVHQLGAVDLEVRTTPVDFIAAGGHKWLNSPLGTGLLYVRREIQEELAQAYYGYLGLTSPEGGWGKYFTTSRSLPCDRMISCQQPNVSRSTARPTISVPFRWQNH